MINKEKVKHIAKLARLGLTEKEIAKYQKELSSILDYIEKLKAVDVSGIEPTSQSVLVEMVEENKFSSPPLADAREGEETSPLLPMRKDEPSEKLKTKSEKLLALAPETKNNYIKVKSVFKNKDGTF